MKDAQATGEVFSSQKKTSSNSKQKFLYFFFICGQFFFALPDPDPATQIKAECGSGFATLIKTLDLNETTVR